MQMRIFLFAPLLLASFFCHPAAFAETIVLAVPGPGSLSYLPVYLAKAIAADQSEGLDLKLSYVGGGPVALRELNERNCDFISVGLAAIADARFSGNNVVAIGQLSQSAMYVLLLRSGLQKEVKSLAQLKGKRIGTASSTVQNRSMGHMMTEYLLQRSGLSGDDVQFVSVGQNRESQLAAISSGAVDAMMGDEPFSSELVAQGVAIKLADLYFPKTSADLVGGPLVHASLATREGVLRDHPETVRKVVRMYDRTLQWMVQHTAQEIMDKLADQPGFTPEKTRQLVGILYRNRGMYPRQVAWDPLAVETTETFFHETAKSPAEKMLKFSEFIRDAGK